MCFDEIAMFLGHLVLLLHIHIDLRCVLVKLLFLWGHLVLMVVTETDLQNVLMKLPPLQVTLFPKNDSKLSNSMAGLKLA